MNRTRGDALRLELWRKTHRVLDALRDLDIYTPNESGYPIIEIPLAQHEEIDDVGRYLFDHGIYVTMAAYPLVPKNEVGFRIQTTAANTDEEVDELISVLGACGNTSSSRRASAPPSESRARAWALPERYPEIGSSLLSLAT